MIPFCYKLDLHRSLHMNSFLLFFLPIFTLKIILFLLVICLPNTLRLLIKSCLPCLIRLRTLTLAPVNVPLNIFLLTFCLMKTSRRALQKSQLSLQDLLESLLLLRNNSTSQNSPIRPTFKLPIVGRN